MERERAGIEEVEFLCMPVSAIELVAVISPVDGALKFFHLIFFSIDPSTTGAL